MKVILGNLEILQLSFVFLFGKPFLLTSNFLAFVPRNLFLLSVFKLFHL